MFQGTIVRNEPAFRPRPAVVPGYHKFSLGRCDAFVAMTALDSIVLAANQSAPNETIGYLVGRPFRDADGSYAIVTEAITASSASRMPTTVETSSDDERRLLDALLADHPISEKMGWFHSHPFAMEFYSGTDEDNQRFWSEPYHLGLLATLERRSGTVTVHAFRGPESERLQPPYTARDWAASQPSVPTATFQPLAGPDTTKHDDRPRRDPSHRHVGLVLLGIALCLIVPVAFLITSARIVHKIRQYSAPISAAFSVAGETAEKGDEADNLAARSTGSSQAGLPVAQELAHLQQDMSRINGELAQLDTAFRRLQEDVKQLQGRGSAAASDNESPRQSPPTANFQQPGTSPANEAKR